MWYEAMKRTTPTKDTTTYLPSILRGHMQRDSQSQYLYQRYGSILPTSLIHMPQTLQRLVTFETGCGNGYGHSMTSTHTLVYNLRVCVRDFKGLGKSSCSSSLEIINYSCKYIPSLFSFCLSLSRYIVRVPQPPLHGV